MNNVISKNLTMIVLLGMVLILTGASSAQELDRLAQEARTALERTDALIEYADPLVHASNDPVAVTAFEQATELQVQAWGFFSAGNVAGYRQAKNHTLRAQSLIRTALAHSRANETQDGTVQARLDRAQERLDMAQQALANEGLARLEGLYQAARNNLDRAWEFFRSENYRPALKLADQVEKTAKTIIDAANAAERSREQYDRRNTSVADLVAQATAAAATCASADGKAAAAMAQRAYELAQQLSADQKSEQALKALQSAREMAQKSIRACSGTTEDVARLTHRYEQLRSEHLQLNERVDMMTGDLAAQAKILLQQAQELLTKAKDHLDDGDLANTETSLQAAHLAISRVRDYIGTTR